MVTDDKVGIGPDFIWYHPRPRPSAMMLQGGFGDFYSIFPRRGTGRLKRFDQSGLQKAMSSPRAAGFFIRDIPNLKSKRPSGFSYLDSKKTE